MILADKIINERKKNGWSQEELADKLNVSRQSVSKWEGAQSVPDIQKIIQMAQIFGVSTDYLLKDEIECEDSHMVVDTDNDSEAIRVSMEDANEYIELKKKYTPWLANAVSMCVACPIVLIFLAGYADCTNKISENLAVAIGMLVLFAMIITAVGIFIKSSKALEKFEYLNTEAIETEYGVSGMVKERQKANEHKSEVLLILGVALCIACALPLIIAALAEASDFMCICMTCVLLIAIAVAVNLFIRVGNISDCYKKLLQEDGFTIKAKKEQSRIRPYVSLYWSCAVVIYLAWSFISGNWGFTWIVWPIAGVLFVVYKQIILLITNRD